MKKVILPILISIFLFLGVSQIEAAEKTVLYFFWGEGCPHCEKQKPFLEAMQTKYSELEVKSFETWKNPDNAEIFKQVAASYGIAPRGVPATFIGEFEPIVGYADYMAADIEAKIVFCLANGCVDPGVKAGIVKEDTSVPADSEPDPIADEPQTTEPEPEPEPEMPSGSGSPVVFDSVSEEVIYIEEETGSNETADQATPVKTNDLCLHLFNRPDCQPCADTIELLARLEESYGVSIRQYDITVPENEELYKLFKEKYGLTAASHPIIFVGERYFIGERAIRENIENEVIRCLSEPCICPLQSIRAVTPFMPRSGEVTPEETGKINLPLVGEIDFSEKPLYVMTAVIAFVDGFNPCSLWLITFLMGIIIHTGSKRKILLVGATFLLVTGAAYAFFMVGLLNVFLYIGYLKWIQVTVALVALIFAAVNIKDYFWYKKGLSFTISDKYKPKIFRDMRGVMKDGRSTLAVITGTVVMALGVVLVELPCTAGFPVIWTNIIAQNQVTGTAFALLLLLYMFIYLLIEILVIGGAFVTLRTSRFEEKHGRILKLIGGLIMLALALVMLFKPELMQNIGGSLLIFGSAIAAAFIIMLIHRQLLPRFGIKIGTEENLAQADNEPGQDKGNDDIISG